LEYDCTYEGDESVEYDVLVYSKSGIPTTYHGGVEDAGLRMGGDWDVLGLLWVVFERTESGGEEVGRVEVIFTVEAIF
jgi:hypothetical protein